MAHRPIVYTRRQNIITNQLSFEKRPQYSEEDLYDDKYDAEEQDQSETQQPELPQNLPRVVPSVSLLSTQSVRPTVTTAPTTSGTHDCTPVIRSLVTASTATPIHTTMNSRLGNISFSNRKRSKPGEALAWQSGRLESILLRDDPSASRVPGSTSSHLLHAGKRVSAQRSTAASPSLFPIGAQLVRGRPRGRPRKYYGPTNPIAVNQTDAVVSADETESVTEAHADVLLPSLPTVSPSSSFVPKQSKRSEPQPKEDSILLPLWEYHPPTNNSLPLLDLTAKHDPLASLELDKPTSTLSSAYSKAIGHTPSPETGVTGNPSTQSNSQPTVTGRMKSSSSNDMSEVDLQELKNYRRLNGYTLFVLVNKRKYGASGGSVTGAGALQLDEVNEFGEHTTANQKDANRKWQAIWSTLSEKVRKQWKAKAKRLLKQSEQQNKRDVWNKDRQARDHRRLESQLARSEITPTGLLDLAAHFQLLSDSFATFEKQLSSYGGPVNSRSVEIMLLNGLVCCLIPLLALASEEEVLSDVPPKHSVANGLRHLTYLMPV